MRLSRRLRQQVAGGATSAQVSALATVERLGTPTLGELATSEKVRPPSMTRIVVGLEEAGLVTRQVDDDDRRVARVMLTAEGRRSSQRSRSLRTAFLARRLRRLSGLRAPGPGRARRSARAPGGGGVTRIRGRREGTFRSLHVRNYRIYFTAQLISVVGHLDADGGPGLPRAPSGPAGRRGSTSGLVTALQFLPMLLFGTWGGLIADRVNKRRLLYATQSVAGGAGPHPGTVDGRRGRCGCGRSSCSPPSSAS